MKDQEIKTDMDETVLSRAGHEKNVLEITTSLQTNDNDNSIEVKYLKPANETKIATRKKCRFACCFCCRRPSPATDQEHLNIMPIDNYSKSIYSPNASISSTAQSFPRDIDNHVYPLNKQQKCTKKCVKCCKKFLTFLFSNVGLCCLVVAYSIFGGFIFQKLEAPYEQTKRHFVAQRRTSYVQRIWAYTERQSIFYEENYTRDIEELLKDFQKEILEAKKNGWDGSDGEVEPQWSFAGSLLYSITVITSIGYGHIAPKTWQGRLVTMFYALIGIPLMLLFLANNGTFLGNCFRLLYKYTCRLCTWLCCPQEDSFTIKKERKSGSPSNLSHEHEPLRPQEDLLYVHSNTLSVISVRSERKQPASSKCRNPSRSPSPARRGKEIDIIVEDYDKSKTKESKIVENTRVPIFVSFMIIAVYIFGGALMFSMWEEWDYLEGSYFCFITLSTIGFGDYVPGTISRTDSAESTEKLIMVCVYLLFGLSIIAMCFNLMQEDVRAKCVWLAIKMGLMDRKS